MRFGPAGAVRSGSRKNSGMATGSTSSTPASAGACAANATPAGTAAAAMKGAPARSMNNEGILVLRRRLLPALHRFNAILQRQLLLLQEIFLVLLLIRQVGE